MLLTPMTLAPVEPYLEWCLRLSGLQGPAGSILVSFIDRKYDVKRLKLDDDTCN